MLPIFNISIVISPYTSSLFSKILPIIEELFENLVDRNLPIRRIAYDFSGLIPSSQEYYDLFTDMTAVKREKRLAESVISIKD